MAGELYLWLKALHVVGVIAWLAGLLYLPRLFAYHAEAEPGSDKSETFKTMERRLLRVIMNPAMVASWGLGLTLVVWSGLYREPWMMTKVALVVVLTGLHMAMARWRREFAADRNVRPARFYRIINEVPTVLMIAVIVLVIVRPF